MVLILGNKCMGKVKLGMGDQEFWGGLEEAEMLR
jgi:hypothetical protein